MTSPLDTLLSSDVKKTLSYKYVLMIGDSVMRALYKDLIRFFHQESFSDDDEIYVKGAKRFLGDLLIHTSFENNSNDIEDFEEIREFTSGGRVRIRFYFVTRVYSDYLIHVIFNDIQNQTIKPDFIIMNSCLWDLTRYGPNAMKSYILNLDQMFTGFRQIVNREAHFLWLSTLPVSSATKTNLINATTEYIRLILPGIIRDANYHCRKMCDVHHVIYIDLHTALSRMLHLRLPDGIHWKAIGIRLVNEVLLHHIRALQYGTGYIRCSSFRASLEKRLTQYRASSSMDSQRLSRVKTEIKLEPNSFFGSNIETRNGKVAENNILLNACVKLEKELS